MRNSLLLGGSGWRRRLVTIGAFGAAASVLFGAVAFACTQRVGTLLVCRPPAKTFVNSTQCGKITGTTQTGTPSMPQAGALFSAKAADFKSTIYNVTWRKPNATDSCHSAGPNTVVLTSTGGKSTFKGPSFYAEFSPANNPVLVSSTLGQAKVCSQDMPDIIVGQIINVAVI